MHAVTAELKQLQFLYSCNQIQEKLAYQFVQNLK